jgi:hypothetical protein
MAPASPVSSRASTRVPPSRPRPPDWARAAGEALDRVGDRSRRVLFRRKLALRRVSSRAVVALLSLGTIPAGALVSPFVQLPLLALVLIAVFSIELSRQRRAT